MQPHDLFWEDGVGDTSSGCSHKSEQLPSLQPALWLPCYDLHGTVSWPEQGQTGTCHRGSVWWILPCCVLFIASALCIPFSCGKARWTWFLWWIIVRHATYVLYFLSLYPLEKLKHQPYTLTNSTWTFSSCFFLKQSQNTLVKKIYDNFSIFFHFICLLNSTF